MKTKPRQLSITAKAGSIVACHLSDMHKASSGNRKMAELVFGHNHLVKYKIDPSDIIEVTGMGESSSDDIYKFDYIVIKPDCVEQKVSPSELSIEKAINVTMYKDTMSRAIEGAMYSFVSQTAFYHDDYWWSISAKEEFDHSVLFTLTNPYKLLEEWELKHKPAPAVIDNPRGILSPEPIETPEPKQPDIVYIAGAISGDVVANRHRFAAAKHNILASSDNVTVLNPAELPAGLTESQFMSICLPMVMMSTSVFMLTGWDKSKGAVAEHALAEKLGIEINYQGQHDGKL